MYGQSIYFPWLGKRKKTILKTVKIKVENNIFLGLKGWQLWLLLFTVTIYDS